MTENLDTQRDLEVPERPDFLTFEDKMEAIIEIILEPFYSRVGASTTSPYSALVTGLVDVAYEQVCLSKQGLPLTISSKTVQNLMKVVQAYIADMEEKK